MTNKARKIFIIINTWIVCLMVGAGAVAKLLKLPRIVEDFSKLGVGNYLQILGIAELLFLGLLLYPKTIRFGYLLFCGYFGGAIATQLSHNGNPYLPAIPLLFITLSVILRDKLFFIQRPAKFINV